MSKTAVAVGAFASAFNADMYKVQMKNRLTDEGFWVEYSAAQLLKPETVKHLQWRNLNGFDVYARPVGWQYILLDDLTRDVLTNLATLRPCMLMETSPDNFQAWLILPEQPADRDTAKAICRELAERFGADLGSAEPDHVGRLPGFTNRKEKHRMANGLFPFVQLHRHEHRVSTFYPFGGAGVLLPERESKPNTAQRRNLGNSTSEQDFGVACGLIRAGRTDDEITAHLMATSPGLDRRKGKYALKYLQKTINNAHKKSIQYSDLQRYRPP